MMNELNCFVLVNGTGYLFIKVAQGDVEQLSVIIIIIIIMSQFLPRKIKSPQMRRLA